MHVPVSWLQSIYITTDNWEYEFVVILHRSIVNTLMIHISSGGPHWPITLFWMALAISYLLFRGVNSVWLVSQLSLVMMPSTVTGNGCIRSTAADWNLHSGIEYLLGGRCGCALHLQEAAYCSTSLIIPSEESLCAWTKFSLLFHCNTEVFCASCAA